MFEPRPIPFRSVLDTRPRSEAAREPILDAVNIPLEELADRTYELPPKSETIQVADTGEGAELALQWLVTHGRTAKLKPATPGTKMETGRLWSPNPLLEHYAHQISPRTAVDLGCGAGREAVFLASLGWKVMAVDNLPDAIQRASMFAERYPQIEGRIEWLVADLEKSFPQTPNVQLVTSFYFLDRAALSTSVERLDSGGTLLLETFTELHKERYGKPQSDERLLKLGELAQLSEGLKIHHLSEDWRPNGRHTARVWATKP